MKKTPNHYHWTHNGRFLTIAAHSEEQAWDELKQGDITLWREIRGVAEGQDDQRKPEELDAAIRPEITKG